MTNPDSEEMMQSQTMPSPIQYSEAQMLVMNEFAEVKGYTLTKPLTLRSSIPLSYSAAPAKSGKSRGMPQITTKYQIKVITTTQLVTIKTRNHLVLGASEGETIYPLVTLTGADMNIMENPHQVNTLLQSRTVQDEPDAQVTKTRKHGAGEENPNNPSGEPTKRRGGRPRKTATTTEANEPPKESAGTENEGEKTEGQPDQNKPTQSKEHNESDQSAITTAQPEPESDEKENGEPQNANLSLIAPADEMNEIPF